MIMMSDLIMQGFYDPGLAEMLFQEFSPKIKKKTEKIQGPEINKAAVQNILESLGISSL